MGNGWKLLAGVAAVATAYILLKDEDTDVTVSSSLERTSNPNIKTKTTYRSSRRSVKKDHIWTVEFTAYCSRLGKVAFNATIRQDGDELVLDSVSSTQLDLMSLPIVDDMRNPYQRDAIEEKAKMFLSIGQRDEAYTYGGEKRMFERLLQECSFTLPHVSAYARLV